MNDLMTLKTGLVTTVPGGSCDIVICPIALCVATLCIVHCWCYMAGLNMG